MTSIGNNPALINIKAIPSREDVCSRKAFDVVKGQMKWHSSGDYLAVCMCVQKKGKAASYVVEFFRICEPGIPVELLELKNEVLTCQWEENGERVALVTHNPNDGYHVSFYSMGAVEKIEKNIPGMSKLRYVT
jgi:translation initiation factor 3 subunit B